MLVLSKTRNCSTEPVGIRRLGTCCNMCLLMMPLPVRASLDKHLAEDIVCDMF